ncbi:4-hydroxy-tetrahydrodipicolinate reductase [Frankliniella fusca]|uniref:4-hydroxy-tetrahydrodipicolinate reductase n=1 Tax=Frankliniella fusca TaxID=407009 RepID=A0AAE1L9M0_9NEOP|nr:4-hydroxy-tetrahydrodipicolinate reductase [Frankliniella fusca]
MSQASSSGAVLEVGDDRGEEDTLGLESRSASSSGWQRALLLRKANPAASLTREQLTLTVTTAMSSAQQRVAAATLRGRRWKRSSGPARSSVMAASSARADPTGISSRMASSVPPCLHGLLEQGCKREQGVTLLSFQFEVKQWTEPSRAEPSLSLSLLTLGGGGVGLQSGGEVPAGQLHATVFPSELYPLKMTCANLEASGTNPYPIKNLPKGDGTQGEVAGAAAAAAAAAGAGSSHCTPWKPGGHEHHHCVPLSALRRHEPPLRQGSESQGSVTTSQRSPTQRDDGPLACGSGSLPCKANGADAAPITAPAADHPDESQDVVLLLERAPRARRSCPPIEIVDLVSDSDEAADSDATFFDAEVDDEMELLRRAGADEDETIRYFTEVTAFSDSEDDDDSTPTTKGDFHSSPWTASQRLAASDDDDDDNPQPRRQMVLRLHDIGVATSRSDDDAELRLPDHVVEDRDEDNEEEHGRASPAGALADAFGNEADVEDEEIQCGQRWEWDEHDVHHLLQENGGEAADDAGIELPQHVVLTD